MNARPDTPTKAGRVVILGASGFVGTALTERLRASGQWEVVPVIHSPASAWRLARHGEPLAQVEIADKAALRQLLQGASHVVNCTRGDRSVMIDAFAGLLAVCKELRVQRFVHLSSVMVYGDPPPPEAATEDGPVVRGEPAESYAGQKLEQDVMVEAAARDGLSALVLCPPNISGPFSLFLCGIVDGLRKGKFGLVGDGSGPCNLVDVRTLCHAIELALAAPASVARGQRLFVTDGGNSSWADLVRELQPLAQAQQVAQLDRELVAARARKLSTPPQGSLGRSIRHLVSSDVRAALRKDPYWAKVDRFARASAARMGSQMEDKLRKSIEGLPPLPIVDPLDGLQFGLLAQQLRQVRHRPDRAREQLGFTPPVDFAQSMADFRDWYRCFFGLESADDDLIRPLLEP